MGQRITLLSVGTVGQIVEEEDNDYGGSFPLWISVICGCQDAGQRAIFVTQVAKQLLIVRKHHGPFQIFSGQKAALRIAEAILGDTCHQRCILFWGTMSVQGVAE